MTLRNRGPGGDERERRTIIANEEVPVRGPSWHDHHSSELRSLQCGFNSDSSPTSGQLAPYEYPTPTYQENKQPIQTRGWRGGGKRASRCREDRAFFHFFFNFEKLGVFEL